MIYRKEMFPRFRSIGVLEPSDIIILQVTGATGATGTTGSKGETGAAGGSTGPTGSFVTTDNAMIVNPASQLVPNNTAIPLITNLVLNGSSINHIPGSAQILLSPDQTYLAIYETSVTTTPGVNAQVVLQLNGLPIIGSESINSASTIGFAVELNSQAIINTVPDANSILTLVNISGSSATFSGTNITIIRLS